MCNLGFPSIFLKIYYVLNKEPHCFRVYVCQCLAPNSSGNMQKHGYLGNVHIVSARENISGLYLIRDDVVTWNYFPHYRLSLEEIHRSTAIFYTFVGAKLNNLLKKKQSNCHRMIWLKGENCIKQPRELHMYIGWKPTRKTITYLWHSTHDTEPTFTRRSFSLKNQIRTSD